ncbi:MamK family actin-like protein [Phycisphaerales bacterium AB-hyl4]|uniref:MamK family actin-like protein n=1 Tax=Natronomicrosphaera hydrolytica TaxID=3242702 RepID=A0ABV4U3M8_9BACT
MTQTEPTAGGKPNPQTKGRPVGSGSDEDMGDMRNALLIGIDLGTSRTSIASINGVRKTVESYVGWAKDPVSRKHLGRDIIFGKAALDNRLSVDLYRPLEHGVIKHTGDGDEKNDEYNKNLEAAQELVRHIVHMTEPGRDDVLYGVVGVPAQATKRNKQAILEICQGVLDSVMIVSEPFAVAYGMERTSDVLVIDIGAGTTDLVRMHGTMPGDDDQVSFNIAGDAIDRKLLELIKKNHPEAQITITMCKRIKEQYGFVSSAQDRIMVTLPVDGKPTEHDLTKEVKEACEIIVQPILDGIHKLVSSFDPEFQEKLRNNIILAGGGGTLDGLNKRIEDGLDRVGGGSVTVVDEPMYAGANGSLQLAADMPAEYWQQLK